MNIQGSNFSELLYLHTVVDHLEQLEGDSLLFST